MPKIYIESSRGARTVEEFKENLKWLKKRKQELRLETITTMPSDDKIRQIIEQKPNELAKLIKKFVNKIDE
ncbi:MAG: hypothetical protein E7158_01505 [Firmicutes bacterium]|nr:hypothetical protein [Bacillota bacterium]